METRAMYAFTLMLLKLGLISREAFGKSLRLVYRIHALKYYEKRVLATLTRDT